MRRIEHRFLITSDDSVANINIRMSSVAFRNEDRPRAATLIAFVASFYRNSEGAVFTRNFDSSDFCSAIFDSFIEIERRSNYL